MNLQNHVRNFKLCSMEYVPRFHFPVYYQHFDIRICAQLQIHPTFILSAICVIQPLYLLNEIKV